MDNESTDGVLISFSGNFIARCFAPAREVRENYLACCCAGSGYSSVDLSM